MTKTIEDLFIFLAVYTAFVPIILFFLFFNKTKNNWVLIALIVYSSLEFATNLTSPRVAMKTMIFLYSIFTIVEYLLFATLSYLLIKSAGFKKILILLSIAFIVFAIVYYTSVKYRLLDSIPIGVETMLILAYVFYLLYQELDSPSQILIYHRYSFWIAAGILIYLAGSFFIYIFANAVDSKTRHEIWIFQNAFTTIKNLCFGICILIYVRNNKIVSSNKNIIN